MRVEIKLASSLRGYMPEGTKATDDGSGLDDGQFSVLDIAHDTGRLSLEVDEATTAADIISLLKIPADQRLMVIVDGAMVPRAGYQSHRLTEGQIISLNPPIQAG